MYSNTLMYERSEAYRCDIEESWGSMLLQDTLEVSGTCYLEESQKQLLRISFAE